MSKVEDLVRFVGLKYRFSKDNEAENSLQICKRKYFVKSILTWFKIYFSIKVVFTEFLNRDLAERDF